MENRNINWFYESKLGVASILELPAYLELYYRLFQSSFDGLDDEDKRFSFLCWLFSHRIDSYELELARTDKYILELLVRKSKFSKILEESLYLSNFHYYYYSNNKAMFEAWGISIDTSEGQLNYLSWCYSRGLLQEDIFYFQTTKKKFLKDSGKYHLENFDISKALMLIIDTDKSHNSFGDDLMNISLKRRLSFIIFNYSQYCYALSDNQVSQLIDTKRPTSVLKEFWDYFFEFYAQYDGKTPSNDIDVKLLSETSNKSNLRSSSEGSLAVEGFKYINYIMTSQNQDIVGRDLLLGKESFSYVNTQCQSTILSLIEEAKEHSTKGEHASALLKRAHLSDSIIKDLVIRPQMVDFIIPILEIQLLDAASHCIQLASSDEINNSQSEAYFEKGAAILGRLIALYPNQPDWVFEAHEFYLLQAGIYYIRLSGMDEINEAVIINYCEKASVFFSQLLSLYPEQPSWVCQKDEVLILKISNYYINLCKRNVVDKDLLIKQCKVGFNWLNKLMSKYPRQPDWVFVKRRQFWNEIIGASPIDLSEKDIHPLLKQMLRHT